VTVEDYRETSLQAWRDVAGGWERRREEVAKQNAPVREALLEGLDPQPGQTILELAAGIGDVGYLAAARVGDEGRLISTDFAPEMVEGAKRRAAEIGLRNVEHRVMDAERMDLADDSVDGVLCRFGYMLMSDPVAALRETRRVLRPDGRLAFATWAAPERNPFIFVVGAALLAGGHLPPPDPEGPGVFALPTAERITEVVTQAGFDPPDVRDVPITARHASLDEWWGFVGDIAGPLAAAIAQLTADEAAAVKANITEWASQWETDGGGYELPGVALVALART
jgi:SAM-dependent methyltransferase